MKNFFVIILILSSLFSCTSNVEKPKNLLDEDKMTAILVDLYLHQQGTYLTEINQKKSNFSQVSAQILYNHHTPAEDFRESYRYYYLHPEKYNEILLGVRDRLEEKLPEKEREKRMEDRKKEENKN